MSDTSAVNDVSHDTVTEAAAAGDQAVECDDDENKCTSAAAESLPSTVAPEVDDSPSLNNVSQLSPPADDDTPISSSESSSTDNSPTHSVSADPDTNSAVTLPTDAETNVSSTDPVAASD